MVTVPAKAESTALSRSSVRLSDALKSTIADQLSLSGNDTSWQVPEIVPDTVIAEAKTVLPTLRHWLEPARDGVKLQWLTQLGILVAGAMGTAEVKMRLQAYTADLTYPALCFTEETRRDAARLFKFFPSFAELAAFFDGIVTPRKERLTRIEKLSRIEPAAIAEKRRALEDHNREVLEYEADFKRRCDAARRWRESPEGQELMRNGRGVPAVDDRWKTAALSPERLEELSGRLPKR